MKPESANDLIDTIICCAHSKRFDDIIELIQYIQNKQYNLQTTCGIHSIFIRIFIDECDIKETLTYTVRLLKNLKKVGIDITTTKNVIKDLIFITATPGRPFWTRLSQNGIKELDGIVHSLE